MEHLLNLARTKEERVFIARCLDYVRMAGHRHKVVLTDFLNPGEAALLHRVGAGTGRVRVETWGGYPDAERRRAVVVPLDSRADDSGFEIVLLRISPRGRDGAPGHRDYLGSLLGLGLERDKFGDCLLVQPEGALLYVAADIADYISGNLVRVGRWTVDVITVDPEQYLPKAPLQQEKTITVAAPRLDAVLAAAFNLSRNQATGLIRQGKVHVNWRLATAPDTHIKEGDTVSCRGWGRFKLLENTGSTRKGRQRLIVGFPTPHPSSN